LETKLWYEDFGFLPLGAKNGLGFLFELACLVALGLLGEEGCTEHRSCEERRNNLLRTRPVNYS